MKDNQYEIHTTINGNVYVWDKWHLNWRSGMRGRYILDQKESELRDFGSVESAKRFIDERRKENNVVVSKFAYPPVNEATQ